MTYGKISRGMTSKMNDRLKDPTSVLEDF